MSNVKKLLMAAAGSAGSAGLDVDALFSSYVYTGDNNTRTITNNIDFSTEGGLLWIKNKSQGANHFLFDTARGSTKNLHSNTTDADATSTTILTSFNSDGYSIGTGGNSTINNAGDGFVAWSFRKAPKFFDVQSWTGNGTSGRTISHNLGSDPGMVIIKRTDSTSNWEVFHRSLASGKKLVLNSNGAVASGADITATSSTNITLSDSFTVNGSSATYVGYFFAHNNSDGEFGPNADQDIIKCGTYTGNNSADGPTIDLGFEPQFVFVRRAGTTFGSDWYTFDQSRGALTAKDTNDLYLRFNESGAEDGSLDYISLRPDGFGVHGTGGHTNASDPYIYMAIRRGPLAEPSSASDVFDVTAYTANNTDGRVITTGNKVDLLLARNRNNTSERGFVIGDRVRGSYLANQFSPKYLSSALSNNEATDSDALMGFDYATGFAVGNDSTRRLNFSNYTQIAYTWTRAPSFCDIVNYQGTGSAQNITHNLGVVPEMIWVKRRESSGNWHVYHSAIGNTGKLDLNTTNAVSTSSGPWNDTSPTASVFTVGTSNNTNVSGEELIAYLFATLAGISKVGSFSHTNGGGDTNVDCGFSNGSKLVIVKNVDATANWFVWDSERGIVSGNESYLKLNDTTSEISADFIDPLSSGFTMTSSFGNVGLNNYIFYAIAA